MPGTNSAYPVRVRRERIANGFSGALSNNGEHLASYKVLRRSEPVARLVFESTHSLLIQRVGRLASPFIMASYISPPAKAAPAAAPAQAPPQTPAPAAPHMDAQPMRIPKSVSDQAMQDDRYYGHRQISEAIERMIMALFSCTQDSMSATLEAQQQQQQHMSRHCAPRLSYFVAYALYRTRLPMMVVYFAMLLLKRLKTQYPVARGSSGHRLFISSFMLASKMLCDDAYNNKSWVIVSQNLFSLHEVNQMERELFMYLDLDLRASAEDIMSFAIELETYGAPSVSLDDLKRTRLSPPQSAPASAPPSAASRSPAVRRKTHRRCSSLRPDYWAHSSSSMAMSTAALLPRHYRSESNEWRTSGVPRLPRTLARSSVPTQRSAPIMPSTTHPSYYAASSSAAAAVAASKHYHDASMSPSMSWSSFCSSTNASSMSITTPNSVVPSLRPTPSLSELSLSSPSAGMYNAMPPVPMPHSFYGWEHPAAKVPAYEVNESFRMRPATAAPPRDAL